MYSYKRERKEKVKTKRKKKNGEFTWMVSISTENTLAPSLARSAASGRPTTSDLCDILGDLL